MLPKFVIPHAFKQVSATLVVAFALVTGLVGGELAHAAPMPAAEPASSVEEPTTLPSRSPEEVAAEQAQRTGQPVEVLELRTEDETVVANPDGSFTSEVTAGPQRAKLSDGSWEAVDPTLVRRADGSIAPRVAAVDLTLSGGDEQGDLPLLRLADGDQAMVLDWPKPLPVPVLAGPVATYQEVLPDVDLRVEASSVGYQYVLVVKSAQAAADAELARIQMAVRGEGLTVREGADGGLEAVNGSGEAVFAGASPSMWDSSGAEAGDQAGDQADAPSTGDRTADVAMSVADGKLSIVPDASLLSGTATTYPVYIDPDSKITKSDWNYVSEAHPSTKYHKFKDDEGVGFCSWLRFPSGDAVCSRSGYINRMYFKFKPNGSDWDDRIVSKAVFRAHETFAFTCTPSWVDLHLVDDSKVDSGTTWNNKPADGDLMVDRYVSYGRGSSCSKDISDPSWVEFADNTKEEKDENLTPTVRKRLADGKPIAFSLAAKNEKDPNSWKRFDGDTATLSVTYRTRPSKPFNEKMTAPDKPCATGAARPFIPNDKPVLVANANDADSENLSVRFVLTDVTTGKDVQTTTDGPKAHKAGGKNVDFKAQVSPELVHGHTYKWHARAKDSSDLESVNWSDWCEYSVDREAPDVAPAVSSTDFPLDAANKKPGEPGKVTFKANGVTDPTYGDDIDFYEWAIGDDNPRNKVDAATTGGDAEATITASTFGPNVLYVRSVDRAGNRSAVTRYVFRAVRPCDDPAAVSCAAADYLFDETSGTTAADTSGKNRPLTLSGVDRVDGQRATATDSTDRAVHFDGVADYASRASVVDTRQAFTVAAWVRPSSLSKDMTVVSQAGAHNSGFTLGYAADKKRWVFGRYQHDNVNPAATDLVEIVADTTVPPVAGQWAYLVGYFNPGNNSLTLYVDGKQVGTTEYPGTVWNAEGGLQLGRAKANDKWVESFAGDVDDVRIYPGGLAAVDIEQLWHTSRPSA